MIELNKIYKDDVLNLIKLIPDESVDVIPIDPPFLYLKNQKLEREFDERLFFTECKRILKKDGFIILFGRGTSFYRWNVILDELGMLFKEEIIWDKSYGTSPLMAIQRCHETISIHCKGRGGAIKKVKVPYLEMKECDIPAIVQDIKRIKAVINNDKSLEAVKNYLENGVVDQSDRKPLSTTVSSIVAGSDRAMMGIKAINEGMNEKDIIKQVREHYTSIHPTQKPVRLIERLLQLVVAPHSTPRPVAATFFSGSGAHEIACINLGIDYIGCEIDDEYYAGAVERTEKRKQEIEGQLFKQVA